MFKSLYCELTLEISIFCRWPETNDNSFRYIKINVKIKNMKMGNSIQFNEDSSEWN